MHRFLLSIFLLLCISCGPGDGDGNTGHGERKDGIQFNYDRARDKALSLEGRSAAINRSWTLLDGNIKDSIFGYVLYQKSRMHFNAGQYDSLLYYNVLFEGQGPQLQDDYNRARQHYLMGYYYSEIVKDYDLGFLNYSKSRNLFGRIRDSVWVARALVNMGTIQKDQNDFFGSKETLTEALGYLRSPEDDATLASCFNLLATNHRKLANFGDAILYYDRAIKKANSLGKKQSFENNLAASLIDEGQYGKAIEILERIGQDSSLDRSSILYARVLDNLSYAQWLDGKKEGPGDFMEALKVRIDARDRRGQIASYTHLGEFYAKVEPRRSMAYFDSVVKLSRAIGNPLAEKDVIAFMMELQPDDIRLRDRYIFLQDSLYQEELKVKTQFAKYKYDDIQAKESILRLEKEQAEAALEAARGKNQLVISIFIMVSLILGIGFVIYYFNQRTKRLVQENRTARMEATLDTEAELSRRLHDDFGSGLNQAMLMIQGKSDDHKVLDVIEGLYTQSRSFSREINEVETGRQFREEFMEMLSLRTPSNTKLVLRGHKDMDWDAMAPLSKKVLFKVLQELMINMGKHSEATLVTIGFKREGDRVRVDYVDNGVGAGPGDLKSKNGLRNTEKRIGAIGGTIIFDSGKDKGFRANMVLPY